MSSFERRLPFGWGVWDDVRSLQIRAPSLPPGLNLSTASGAVIGVYAPFFPSQQQADQSVERYEQTGPVLPPSTPSGRPMAFFHVRVRHGGSWRCRSSWSGRCWRPASGWWPSRHRAAGRTAAAAPRSAGPVPGRAKSPPRWWATELSSIGNQECYRPPPEGPPALRRPEQIVVPKVSLGASGQQTGSNRPR
jgi:hypothetical protein